MPYGKKINWTPARIALLDKYPKSMIAELLGVTKQAIAVARRRFHKPKPQDWPACDVRLLGIMSDRAVAKLVGKHKSAVQMARVRRRIPAWGRWR